MGGTKDIAKWTGFQTYSIRYLSSLSNPKWVKITPELAYFWTVSDKAGKGMIEWMLSQ